MMKQQYCFHKMTLRESGFTLIELLVVLVIIGILAGYIGPKIMGHPEEAKRTKAALQIQGLETALKMYKLDNVPVDGAGASGSCGAAGHRQAAAEMARGWVSGEKQGPSRPMGQ